MFRLVTPPIIRSTYNSNYSIWHWSSRLCYLPVSWNSWNAELGWPVPDAVITVICAPDYGWSYHPKHAERAVYRNIINCIYLHLVGQLLTLPSWQLQTKTWLGQIKYFLSPVGIIFRSHWPCGLRRGSTAAHLLRSWVRIPPGARMFVCCVCCVLSGRGLCDELITRSEESYRLCCVVVCDLETSSMRRPWPALGRSATWKKSWYNIDSLICWRSLFLTREAQIFHSNFLIRTIAANLHFSPRQQKLLQSHENVVSSY